MKLPHSLQANSSLVCSAPVNERVSVYKLNYRLIKLFSINMHIYRHLGPIANTGMSTQQPEIHTMPEKDSTTPTSFVWHVKSGTKLIHPRVSVTLAPSSSIVTSPPIISVAHVRMSAVNVKKLFSPDRIISWSRGYVMRMMIAINMTRLSDSCLGICN